MTHGRGAWTKVGMPANAPDGMYRLLAPVLVGSSPQTDQSHRAVNYGVRAIQVYVNQLYRSAGLPAPVHVSGVYDHPTRAAVQVAQFVAGVTADGVFGPRTAQAFFWPTLKTLAPASWARIVGGICHLESGFDPSAVGYVVDNDLGLAQINLPANPTTSEAQAFDPHYALQYLAKRVVNALTTITPQGAAIVQYNNPSWSQQWAASGKAPNADAQTYVDLVLAWKP
jgi:peptidoglycan hydrolase-like protein with peptidoglycan-binding domain